MVNATRHFSDSLSAKSMFIIAGLLILLGTVLQLGEFGYSHVSLANFWLLSMLTQSLWYVLSLHLNSPAMEEVLRFWPLMLVSLGLAILMLRLERK